MLLEAVSLDVYHSTDGEVLGGCAKPIMLYLYGESALGWNTTQCVRVCTRSPMCVSACVRACVRACACLPVVCRDFLPSHLLTPQMLQTGNDFDSYSTRGVCETWVLMSFYFLRHWFFMYFIILF